MKLYSALFGLSMIWGLSFVFIKWLTEASGVWGTVFFRCLAGAVILLPFLWAQRKKITRPIPWKHLIIAGLFNGALPWGLISLSETQINSNTASVLNALTPIFSGLVGFIIFSKALSGRQWIGIIIGFCGILVLMDFNASKLLGQSFIGIGTMVIAALFYGFGSQYTKKYLKNAGILFMTTCSLLVGAFTGLIGMAASGALPVRLEISPLFLISVIGLGCFGSGIAHLLYYYLMTEGTPEFATAVTYLIPVTAMVWGYVLLKEEITNYLLLGLAFIFIGIYFSNKNSFKKEVRTASG